MARTLLFFWYRQTQDQADELIEVFYDSDDNAIRTVYDGFPRYSDTKKDGPRNGQKLPYSFCTGTTKTYFEGTLGWPFAKKLTETNSIDCGYHLCDLQLVSPIATTPDAGQGGTVTLAYTGTASNNGANIRYSVDGQNWFTANTFTLDADSYTAYVRDEDPLYAPDLWCRHSLPFVITEQVVHGLRYFLDFDNVRGELYRLEIYKRAFTGTPEKVCGTGSPVKLDYQIGHRYSIINQSKADVGLESDVNFKFLDFFSSDEREHLVVLKKGTAVAWKGYLLPDVYNEPFVSAIYQVSATASDGLGTLKQYPYIDNSYNPYTGERSLLDIIFDCLDKLELDLPLRSVVDVYEANMREAADTSDTDPVISDPLFQATVNTAVFLDAKGKPLDCAKVLEYCLGFLGARVFQDAGRWNVECIDAKRGPFWAVDYAADRTFMAYHIIDPVTPITGPELGDLFWVGGDQQLEITPAYKKTVVEAELQVIKNLLPGGDFPETEFIDDTTLAHFKGNVPIHKVKTGEGKYSITLGGTADDFSVARSLESDEFHLEAEEGTLLLLTVGYQVAKGMEGDNIPRLAVQVEGQGFSLTNPGTQSLSGDITITSQWEPQGIYKRVDILATQVGSNATYQLITPPIPATGPYKVRLFELFKVISFTGSYGELRYNSVSLQVLPGGVYPLEEVEVEVNNPARYTFRPEPLPVYFTDTQPTLNFKQTHKNYISVNGVQSSSWHFKGDTENGNGILSLLAANVAYNHTRPSHVLRGTLQGHVGLGTTLKEQYDFNRLFLVCGLSVDIRNCTASGTFHELVTPLQEAGARRGFDYTLDFEFTS